MAVIPPIEVGIHIRLRTQDEADWYAERLSFIMRGEELPEYEKMREHLGSVMAKYRDLLAVPRTNYMSFDFSDPAVDQGDLKLSRAIFEAQSFTTPEKLADLIMGLIESGEIFR